MPHKSKFLTTIAVVVALLSSAAFAIEKAGDLIVDVDAATFEVGSGTWTNAGSYPDFTADGNPGLMTIGDAPAVIFDGETAFIGPDSPPLEITSFETRSIEAWVFNPTISSEETVVSWGKRGGPDGSNMAFNYGNHGNFGAVGHWGGGGHDVGWVDNDFTFGAPEAYKWHHLVYTYDEEVTRVYADGVLQNSEDTTALWGELNTYEDPAIAIAAQWNDTATFENVGDPANLNADLKGTLGIGRLRIHSDVLSDAQIVANFDEEKALYSTNPPLPAGIELDELGQLVTAPTSEDPVARPLSTSPVNRYSFNNPASEDASGAELTDSIGGAHGVVIGGTGFVDPPEFTGTGLRLPGGVSLDAPYGDLPNGLISGLTSATIEAWVTVEGNQSWSRVFDFGSTEPGGDDGELEDAGGGGQGLDYLFLSAQRGDETNQHRVEIRNEDPAGGGINTVDFDVAKELPADAHFAVVYDAEATPEFDFLLNPTGNFTPGLKVYANGQLVAEGPTDIKLSDINDVNNWLGRSNWTNDANFQGTFDEFRIFDKALSGDEILGSFEAGPDELVISEIVAGDCNGDGVVDIGDLDCIIAAGGADALNALLTELNLLAGDLDADGTVGFSDFLVVSANFNQAVDSYVQGDINADGVVSFPDFLVVSTNFNKSAAATSAVPEPSGIAMVVVTGLGILVLRRRRRRCL